MTLSSTFILPGKSTKKIGNQQPFEKSKLIKSLVSVILFSWRTSRTNILCSMQIVAITAQLWFLHLAAPILR